MGANCQIEQQAGGKMVIKAEATPMSLGSACSSISVAEKDSKGMTNQKLLAATRDNDVEGIQKAVSEGAYLETRRPFVMRPKPPSTGYEPSGSLGKKRKTPKEGLTPLMYAAQNGSVEAAKVLLEARAQVQARDEDGMQPIHFAATGGSLEVCSVLLSHGADKTAQTDDGRRAVDFVAEAETKEVRAKWEAMLGPQLVSAEIRPQGCEGVITTTAMSAQRDPPEFVFAAAEVHAPNALVLTDPLRAADGCEIATAAPASAPMEDSAARSEALDAVPPAAHIDFLTPSTPTALVGTTEQAAAPLSLGTKASESGVQLDLLCADAWEVTNWPDPQATAFAGANVTPSVATAGA
jgi:hypothetical protein